MRRKHLSYSSPDAFNTGKPRRFRLVPAVLMSIGAITVVYLFITQVLMRILALMTH